MNVTIVVAAIALVGAVLSAAISLYGQARSTERANRRAADAVLSKYSEPLLAAAYELQGRLYNILALDFLQRYYRSGDEEQRTYAVENTLYVIAQYFGWSEILRREIQFLSFSDSRRTQVVAAHLRRVVELFQSDDHDLGRAFLVWRGEQRALGELMIDEREGQAHCLGYASFLAHRDEPAFRRWLDRLEGDIDQVWAEPNPRLRRLQNELVELIRTLDRELRYPEEELKKV